MKTVRIDYGISSVDMQTDLGELLGQAIRRHPLQTVRSPAGKPGWRTKLSLYNIVHQLRIQTAPRVELTNSNKPYGKGIKKVW